MRVRSLPLVLLLSAASALGAPVLFPRPLHLVRRIEDPVARTAATVDEYCSGNRIITLRGKIVTIADYGGQELTEINRGEATYSITPFAEIAAARPEFTAAGDRSAAQARGERRIIPRPLGAQSSAGGRLTDAYEIASRRETMQLRVDRSVALSREAVEVLIGAAYPNARRAEHDAVLDAAAPWPAGGRVAAQSSAGPAAAYGLPVDQSVTYDFEGTKLTFRTSVVRIDGEAPPQDALLIPPGARRVESRLTRLRRELHELEFLPTPKP